MKFTIVAVFIGLSLISCQDELSPCDQYEQSCKVRLKQMNEATTEADKEQYRQFYLAEKQLLDHCKSEYK